MTARTLVAYSHDLGFFFSFVYLYSYLGGVPWRFANTLACYIACDGWMAGWLDGWMAGWRGKGGLAYISRAWDQKARMG